VPARFSGHGCPAAWIAADVARMENGKPAEHWDALQDEGPRSSSVVARAAGPTARSAP